jgi:sugar transferase EpsL
MKRATSRRKRGLDVVLSAALLVLTAPLLIVVGIGLRQSTGASSILRQVRAGLQGQPFALLKLRTMTNQRDGSERLLPDAERLTRFGRLVRSLSIDELPQLINVLRGEMSLVGPRPLPMPYARLYTERERGRLAALPGLTGWAQINGRQRIPFGQRLALDVWYVDHWSLGLDVKILLLTVPRLIRRTDVVLGQEVEKVDDRGFAELWHEYERTDAAGGLAL